MTPQRFSGDALPESQPSRIRLEDVLRTLLISAIILGAGIALGTFTQTEIIGRGTPYFILAAGLGVLLAALAYRQIEWVMLAYIAFVWLRVGYTPDIVNNAGGGGHSLAPAQIGLAFLLFIWVLRSAAQGKVSFARLPLNALLVLYLVYNVVSAYNGILFWDKDVARFYEEAGLRDGGRTPLLVVSFELLLRVLSVGAFWLFANNLRDGIWVRRASWLLLLPGVLIFVAYFTHLPLPISSWSVLLEVVVACTLFAWLLEPRIEGTREPRWLRSLGWVALCAVVFQVFFLNLNWVSGWFGLFVGLYCVAFLRSRRLFAGLLAAGFFLYVAGQAFLQATVVHKVQTSGDAYRFAMAHGAVMYALKFPLGVGPGNYRNYNLYYGSPSQWGTSTFTSAHGFYSQMLSELGFGGLIITVAFVLTAMIMLVRFYNAMPPGASRTFVMGLTGMWVGICAASGIGDYLIPVYYNGGVGTMGCDIFAWIGLGIAVAHARLYGLVRDTKPEAVKAPVPSATDYYPRKMGREPS